MGKKLENNFINFINKKIREKKKRSKNPKEKFCLFQLVLNS